jgi:crotonobetainyl-CoA:carnitine CoA-transferase CaiB-like acyl-CoA transferase
MPGSGCRPRAAERRRRSLLETEQGEPVEIGEPARGPLAGLRVVDMTLALAGPACTQRLADWGADVVKVEPPGTGEWTRSHPIVNARLQGETTVFLSLNRNKRSIGIDAKSQRGRELVLRLAERADVFVHNFRMGVMERLGLTAPDILARNPRIIYASVNGYGERGPDSRRPGQDLLLQAYAGTMFSVGSQDDPPQPGPIFVADVLAGHMLVEAILAAIIERDRTGAGQEVNVSMLGAMLDAQLQELVTFLNCGLSPTKLRSGAGHAFLNPPYGVFRAADGWIAIAMAEPRALGEALGSAAVSGIETWEEAAQLRDLIRSEVQRLLPEATVRAWLDRFERAGVWAGPVHRYEDLADHPQIVQNGFISATPLAEGGSFLAPDGAAQFSSHKHLGHRAPPPLSGDARAVLTELGVDPGQQEQLFSEGIVEAPKC